MLLAWENEALLAKQQLGPDKFDIVLPSLSILAEPPVTVVDKVVDRRGTRTVAEAYLKFLYTPPGQEIIAQNFYRPRDCRTVAQQYAGAVPGGQAGHRSTTPSAAGSRRRPTHFADGGTFDQIYGQ